MSHSSSPTALLSVSDKRRIADLGRALADAGWRILSTGGTAQHLRDADVPVTPVSDVTGFPEIMDGRVKTLHPKIHGGILANRDVDAHHEAMHDHDIPAIDLVVVNLYPFEQTIAQEGVTLDEAIEQIDIGGPTMVRASAKNFAAVTIVVDPDDYTDIIHGLKDGGIFPTLDTRRQLALKAFEHTASYDRAIVEYLGGLEAPIADPSLAAVAELPAETSLALRRTESLRYGENPHQPAALYHANDGLPFGGVEQLGGKALSYNNIVDLDAAIALVQEFDDPAAAIIKHTNPAGCAQAADPADAYEAALSGDPMSAFGGIAALNRPVTPALAARMSEHFFEIIAAPAFEEAALQTLSAKKNLRLMLLPEELPQPIHTLRATSMGTLMQAQDPRILIDTDAWEVPTERAPTDEEMAQLAFAWRVCKHVKSNAIVLAKGTQTIGIGAGQMSRVDAVELAIKKSTVAVDGAVLASDAFFPFRDGPDTAADAGVRAIIQPGGSRRDQEVIDACDEHGIAMVHTGKRHFRH